MFDLLTSQLQNVFDKLKGKRRLTEENLKEAIREVRVALLNADVNYGVTKTFVKRVKEKACGDEVIKSVTPGQQFIKVVHDELVALMGSKESKLNLDNDLSVIMVCGLQGSGKTTQCVKLAKYLKKLGKKPLLVACDLQRLAAIDQLKTLSAQIQVPVYSIPQEDNPVKVAKKSLKESDGYDVCIVDTAGRLHIDKEMMQELVDIRSVLSPHDILFVANAATGQDAVITATEFNNQIEITGTILTMLDGNTRGGAAISIREVTGKPLLFEGIGEKLDDFQLFNPDSMADRILGMGDTINLVRKAQEHVDDELAKDMEKKLRKASFTYEDYIKQMSIVKKMGSMKSLLKMIPGFSSNIDSLDVADKQFAKIEAIILSMTPDERLCNEELTVSRRKRIANGSGTKIEDVNKLIKTFKQMKQFCKNMPNMKNLEKMMGGSFLCH